MENSNAKITVNYTNLLKDETFNIFGTGIILPFNVVSKVEMGMIIANDIVKSHAGQSNFKINWFDAVEI